MIQELIRELDESIYKLQSNPLYQGQFAGNLSRLTHKRNILKERLEILLK